MGWWGFTIMGGNPPMDWEDNFNDITGARPYEDKPIPLTGLMVDEHLYEMVALIQKDKDDPNIGWQVLGVMILTTGAKMPIEIRENIVKNIYDENIDGWDKPNDRKFFLDHFKVQVENYKEGCQEVIAQREVLEVIIKREAEEAEKKIRKRVRIGKLRKELGALIKKYRTSSKVKKTEALQDILIDIIYVCEKSKVDFYNMAANAMEIFKVGKK